MSFWIKASICNLRRVLSFVESRLGDAWELLGCSECLIIQDFIYYFGKLDYNLLNCHKNLFLFLYLTI